MRRLVKALAPYGGRERIGIAPYVTAGDGGLALTLDVLHALEEAGASCVELGVPFSDPIADGPVLQAAAQRALAAGTTLEGILELVERFRSAGGELPLLLFSYANPLFSLGIEGAARALSQAGLDGLLVPDLPVEELEPWSLLAREAELAPIGFVTPTTSPERMARTAAASRGFLYVIGRTGVTGATTDLAGGGVLALLERVRATVELPLGVGFGIKSAAQVRALAPQAALAIVGSALVDHLHRVRVEGGEVAAAAAAFVRALAGQ